MARIRGRVSITSEVPTRSGGIVLRPAIGRPKIVEGHAISKLRLVILPTEDRHYLLVGGSDGHCAICAAIINRITFCVQSMVWRT